MAFDPFTAAFDLINTGLSKWIPDANLRQAAAQELAGQVNMQIMGQIEMNKVEAASQSKFVSGWRPFIGWTCGVAYAYTFVVQPIVVFMFAASGYPSAHSSLPVLHWSELSMVLFGMLGLGAMRSYEKVGGKV